MLNVMHSFASIASKSVHMVSSLFTGSDCIQYLYHSNNVQTHLNMLDDSLTTGDLIDMFYENYLKSFCTLSYRYK